MSLTGLIVDLCLEKKKCHLEEPCVHRETLFSNLVGGQDDFWKTSLRRHMYWERLGFHGQSLAK